MDIQKNTEEINALREDNRKLTQLLLERKQRQRVSTDSNSSAQATQLGETELREIPTHLKAQIEALLEKSAKESAIMAEKYNEELKTIREENHKNQQLLIEAQSKADPLLLKP